MTAPITQGEIVAGKYEIDKILGEGGMGIVVAARHVELDERVAIKFLTRERSPDAVDRFFREARIASKIKSEHVCRVFDVGRLASGEPYIVMEILKGVDLGQQLEREGKLDPTAAAGWMIEACDAIAEAHDLGIVHRDLKPANIFIANRRDGSACAKVLDFGISKARGAKQLTQTAAMMGSPAYMSPEQLVSARTVDARSDIWSLGVVLYELLSGRIPFEADTIFELARKVQCETPEALAEIPEGLAKAVFRCLEKDPADRYGTIAELVRDLAPFAPPETAALAARSARRLAAATGYDRTIDHAPGSPEPPSSSPAIVRDDEGVSIESAGASASAKEHGRTFAPVQTGPDVTGGAGLRRRPLVIAAIVSMCLAMSAAAWLGRTRAPTSSPVATSSLLSATSPIAAAPEPPAPTPTAPASASVSIVAAPPSQTPPIVSKAPPSPKVQKRPATAAAEPASAAPATSADPPRAIAAPSPAVETTERKRRNLDRDDPYAR